MARDAPHAGFAESPARSPDDGGRRAAIALALFAAAAALSAITILRGINPHDEGLMLQAAQRIVDGQLPYRDFWWSYGPGQPFVLAGLQELFGRSLVEWRVLRVLVDAAVSLEVYWLVRREAPLPLALGAWLAAAGAMAYPSIPNPNPTALALGLAALLLARRSPAGAGAVAGLAVAFRIEIGLAAAVGVALATAAEYDRRAVLRAVTATAAVALVLLGPLVAVSPGGFWDGTIGFALGKQDLQRLPLPGAYHGPADPDKVYDFYFPYVLLAGTALWLLVALRARYRPASWAAVPLLLAGVAYLLARVDGFHLVPLAVVLPILLATAAARERGPAAAALVAALALIALHGLDRKASQILHPPALASLHLDVADGVRADPREARVLPELVRYVQARVPPGDPVWVANPRHDLVKVGNSLVTFLIDRPNPTRYVFMQPGVITTSSVQREVVRDLEEARPRLVVRWDDPVASQREPNGAGRSSGVHILDSYLDRSYVRSRRFGEYVVLRRVSGS